MPTHVIETVMAQLVEEGRALLVDVVRSERDAAVHRMLMGRFLIKARERMPKRARTAEEGWTGFLVALEIDGMTASRYIEYAEKTLNLSVMDKGVDLPTYEQLGITKRTGPEPDPEAPPPRDGDAPAAMQGTPTDDATEVTTEPPKPNRNAWNTPKEIADELGAFDLDPCTNERSHIQAKHTCILERGDDGLHGETGAYLIGGKVHHAKKNHRVFINPPYERGAVARWVKAYKHTRFTFLLRLDTSTEWFDELFASTALILIPKGERIEFEPPADVEASKNPYPHGLFFARTGDAPKSLMKRCYVWRT